MIGYVYIFKSELGYKIGYTQRTPEKRLKEFSKLPYKIDLYHSTKVENPRRIEKQLHQVYENYNINGEWYDLSDDDLIKIKLFLTKYSIEPQIVIFE